MSHLDGTHPIPAQCSPFTYAGTLASPGFCSYCISDTYLSVKDRTRQFTDTTKWRTHVLECLEKWRLKAKSLTQCPLRGHLCGDTSFDSHEDMLFHLNDFHGTPTAPKRPASGRPSKRQKTKNEEPLGNIQYVTFPQTVPGESTKLSPAPCAPEAWPQAFLESQTAFPDPGSCPLVAPSIHGDIVDSVPLMYIPEMNSGQTSPPLEDSFDGSWEPDIALNQMEPVFDGETFALAKLQEGGIGVPFTMDAPLTEVPLLTDAPLMEAPLMVAPLAMGMDASLSWNHPVFLENPWT